MDCCKKNEKWIPDDIDVYFIFFSGEEQNYLGSKAWVEDFSTKEMDKFSRTVMMQNFDMISFGDGDLVLEGNNKCSNFLHYIKNVLCPYVPKLKTELSFSPWGSDHVSFLNKKIPAMLWISGDVSNYKHYHKTTDTFDKVSKSVGIEVLKLTAISFFSLVAFFDNLKPQTPYNNNKKKEKKEKSTPLFFCDGCDKFINTTRYHCNNCTDYDLCSICYKDKANLHNDSHQFQIN
eukprot:TRINITY_DN7136_c0_g1_i1.p1 TRINITY_DN7136_c0_g1~~TRINITY_DN7136_c0_g1_i1.p1  ORF type:complete len:233 (-),score=55.01 TRINITY_DN7136_c0_g1_i1:14-712(-)